MSAVSGLRKRRTTFFVQVPRDTIRDKEISLRAKGLLTYLLDLPEGWDVKSEAISRENKEGREAIRTALHELGERGYYRIERRRLLTGKFQMGTAISEERVEEWAEEYAEFEGKPVPCQQQKDGTFLVQRKDGSLRPDGFTPEPEVDGSDDDPDGGGPSGITGDGFSGPGDPASGRPASGTPASGARGAIREREKGDPEGSSDSSLRSESAPPSEGLAEVLPLPGLATAPAPVQSAEEDLGAQAREIVTAFLGWVEQEQGAPIPGKDKSRAFNSLVREYVAPALGSGYTVNEVKKALVSSGHHWPSKQVWTRELVKARGGRPLEQPQRNAPRNAFQSSAEDQAAASVAFAGAFNG